MKKKIFSNTYLREAEKYQIKFYLDEDDYYVSVKKLVHLTDYFYINDGKVLGMGDGYYIMEIISKTENYALRIFFDDKKEVVEYYFDIIKSCGIDPESKIPYFYDLYLDVVMTPNGEPYVVDEDELDEALNNKDITKEEYDLAISIKDKIIEEIKNGTNKLLNINHQKYLEDF